MNIFDFSQNNTAKLHQRTKRYIIKPFDENNLFETNEETYIDQNEGPKTIETISVHPAGCGHYTGFYSPSQLAATCEKCNRTLCFRCCNLRCRRCLSILCDHCAKIVDENTVYCSKCKFFYYIKKTLLIVGRASNEFLSKDIS